MPRSWTLIINFLHEILDLRGGRLVLMQFCHSTITHSFKAIFLTTLRSSWWRVTYLAHLWVFFQYQATWLVDSICSVSYSRTFIEWMKADKFGECNRSLFSLYSVSITKVSFFTFLILVGKQPALHGILETLHLPCRQRLEPQLIWV